MNDYTEYINHLLVEHIGQFTANQARELVKNKRLLGHLVKIMIEASEGKHYHIFRQRGEDHISSDDRKFFETRGFDVDEQTEHVDIGDGYEPDWVDRYTTYIKW